MTLGYRTHFQNLYRYLEASQSITAPLGLDEVSQRHSQYSAGHPGHCEDTSDLFLLLPSKREKQNLYFSK